MEAAAPGSTSRLARLRRSSTLEALWSNKAGLLGAVFLGALVLVAAFAPLIAPWPPNAVDVLDRLQPPAWLPGGSWDHPLGTDALGRDELSRLIYGARISLLISVSVVLLAGTLGTLLGLAAGYHGGKVDTVIMRLADAQLAFPGLLLIILVLGFLGSSIPVIVAVLTIYGWMIFARLVRAIVLHMRETPAIQAAQLLGCSTPRILFRHLLPALYPALMTQGMLDLARIALAEASLSYLGLGIQPPNASWGLMVAESQTYIQTAWWTVVFPGLALTATVLSVNLVANWLRIHTDPQQRQRRRARRRPRRRERPVAPLATPATGVEPPTGPAGAGAQLSVGSLSVTFHTPTGPVEAVRDVQFEVAPGETLGIVGESGSGKSTAALSLLGLVPPPGKVERLEATWEGEPIAPRALERLRGRDVTMIFQDPMTSLNPLVRVGRQLTEVLVKHKGMGGREARERAEELFSLVGISSPRERLDQFPYELSGGLRQRVMIAMALAPEPKLIVADEPTTALDATIQAQILDLIAKLQREQGIAMVLITHDLGVVARVCDRVAVMYGGRIVEDGPVEAVFAAPRHRYTEALLTAIPRVEDRVDRLPTIPGSPPSPAEVGAGCPFAPRCAHAVERCELEAPAEAHEADGRGWACWNPLVESSVR